MKHMGHYPMLERPAEFDRLAADVVKALLKPAHPAPGPSQRFTR
jgi:hypothetical protein